MIAITFMLIGIVARLLPHPANVAPIAAMALFGGVYLDKRLALVLPFLAMVVSDFFLGFHATMPYVYASFAMTSLLGLWLKNHKSPMTILGTTLAGSVLFYLVTNFGVWQMTSLYPKTFFGLWQCFIMALPFFRNTVLGDLFYTAVFFASYEFLAGFSSQKLARIYAKG